MNCGITGHTGALGQEFIARNKHLNFVKFRGDLTKKNQIIKWVKKNNFDFFLHFAAVVPTNFVNKNYSYAKKVNVIATSNLINSLIKHQKKKLKWFFYSSTSHVYNFHKNKIDERSKTNPISKYGKTKLMGEKILLKKKLNICVGRIFSFTHKSHQDSYLIPSLYRKIIKSKNKSILLENLNHFRDFLDLDDICKAISILMKNQKTGIYNICSSRKTNLQNIAIYMAKKKKIKYKFKKNKYKITNLIGENKKLKLQGWKPKKNISFILNNYLKTKRKNKNV